MKIFLLIEKWKGKNQQHFVIGNKDFNGFIGGGNCFTRTVSFYKLSDCFGLRSDFENITHDIFATLIHYLADQRILIYETIRHKFLNYFIVTNKMQDIWEL